MAKTKKEKLSANYTVESCEEMIRGIFGDTSVSQLKTLERLEEIVSEAEMYIDAIKTDLKKSEGF